MDNEVKRSLLTTMSGDRMQVSDMNNTTFERVWTQIVSETDPRQTGTRKTMEMKTLGDRRMVIGLNKISDSMERDRTVNKIDFIVVVVL